MNIKEYIYKRKYKKHHHPATHFPSWEKVQSILILFDSDITEKNLQIKQLQKELQKEGKTVTAWGYLHQSKIQTSILPQFRIVGKGDVNIFGIPSQAVLNDLYAQHFDMIINLSQDSPLPIRYLSLLAHAGFRAGAAPSDADLQIMLTTDTDVTVLFDQIMYYIKNIKTND